MLQQAIGSSSVNRSRWFAAAALAGSAFIGYCVYFDRKRRADPDYKRKVRERRKRIREERNSSVGGAGHPLPDVNNPTELQAFFLQEVQLGEELLAEGDSIGAVEHLGNAIVMCGQPQQLLQIFQQTLPPQIFSMLTEQLPLADERMSRLMHEKMGTGPSRGQAGAGPFVLRSEGSSSIREGSSSIEGLVDTDLE